MWFQNRRAKWRKQARLSLLQDAWRLRCLGLTSSSSMIANEHRQSPKSDASPSSPIPLIASALTNAPMPKIGDMKLLKDPSTPEECGHNDSKNENFTLMHPAFQNVLQKRKYYGTHGMDAVSMFDKNCTDARNCGNLLANVLHSDVSRKMDPQFDHRLKNAKNDCDNGELSQDSSGSEEIDLTSNGIDFSNNNNEPNSNHNRKSDKCTMNTF